MKIADFSKLLKNERFRLFGFSALGVCWLIAGVPQIGLSESKADSAEYAQAMDSSEMIIDNRSFLSPQFTRITDGIQVNDGGTSAGVAWIDYDNDNYPDLYVTNNTYPTSQKNFLYHNNAGLTFTKVTDQVITLPLDYSRTSTWGDFDNDGFVDAFISNWPGQVNSLYHNEGGGLFSQISLGEIVTEVRWSTAAAWADYDNDGDLDLVVSNYGANSLFRNDNGVFNKMTTGDITSDNYNTYGVSWGDYDNDNDLDLFIAVPNEGNPDNNNRLFENLGDGTFGRVLDGDIVNDGGTSFGGSWGDYDNDGDLDLFVTNVSNTDAGNNFLYVNNGDGTFTKATEGIVVNDGGYSFGSAWGDFDNDGDLDLFVANYTWEGDGRDYLYVNIGDGAFVKVITEDIVNAQGSSYGAAISDYDRDGDLDLFIARCTNGNENNAFYANNGSENNWLNIRCLGSNSNRSAIGTKVRVKAVIGGEEVWQMREISSQTGYCGQNELNVHFGFGDATAADTLIVEWPSGTYQYLYDIGLNQFMIVTEPICGDVDAGGAINILDITFLINYLYKDGPVPPVMSVCDADGSDLINILDVTFLINYLYKDGALPVC